MASASSGTMMEAWEKDMRERHRKVNMPQHYSDRIVMLEKELHAARMRIRQLKQRRCPMKEEECPLHR